MWKADETLISGDSLPSFQTKAADANLIRFCRNFPFDPECFDLLSWEVGRICTSFKT